MPTLLGFLFTFYYTIYLLGRLMGFFSGEPFTLRGLYSCLTFIVGRSSLNDMLVSLGLVLN